MTRLEFVKICGILGIGIPSHLSLMSCSKDDDITEPFEGEVIVIGAGAGGLSAGYLLQQQGIRFRILEASNGYGGRMRVNTDFADFPIPLGAEWLETNPTIFREILNNPSFNIDIKTVEDSPDRKFVNSSWYGFFENYVIPAISQRIYYNSAVRSIDYSGNQVVVTTRNNEFKADKVIVSVPLKMLQDRDIEFTPNLPEAKLSAIDNSTIWEGFKSFFEFSTKFYDDEFAFDISPKTDGQKIYYNAAFGQNTTKNILGLFTVGKPALNYMSLSDADLKDYILNELDQIYNNQASPNYVKHIAQNWNKEQYIRSGYMTDYADWKTVRELGKSVNNKVYFAGGAYTDGEDWVSVHTAAQSARRAVEELVV